MMCHGHSKYKKIVYCKFYKLLQSLRPERKVPARLMPWSCTRCTFENAGRDGICKMCGIKKDGSHTQNCVSLSGEKTQRGLRLARGMKSKNKVSKRGELQLLL